MVKLLKTKFAKRVKIYTIVFEIIQNLAFTVFLFKQMGKKQCDNLTLTDVELQFISLLEVRRPGPDQLVSDGDE